MKLIDVLTTAKEIIGAILSNRNSDIALENAQDFFELCDFIDAGLKQCLKYAKQYADQYEDTFELCFGSGTGWDDLNSYGHNSWATNIAHYLLQIITRLSVLPKFNLEKLQNFGEFLSAKSLGESIKCAYKGLETICENEQISYKINQSDLLDNLQAMGVYGIERGYCAGLSGIFALCRILKSNLFDLAVKTISSYIIGEEIPRYEIAIVDQFTALITLFQNPHCYLAITQLRWSELFKCIQYSQTETSAPPLITEVYSFAAVVSFEQLQKMFGEKFGLVRKNTVINLTLSLYADRYHAAVIYTDDTNYYYYDPNNNTIYQCSLEKTDKLADLIQDSMVSLCNQIKEPDAYGVGFTIYTHSGQENQKEYISQKELLKELKISKTACLYEERKNNELNVVDEQISKENSLDFAIYVGALKCVNSFLYQGFKINNLNHWVTWVISLINEIACYDSNSLDLSRNNRPAFQLDNSVEPVPCSKGAIKIGILC